MVQCLEKEVGIESVCFSDEMVINDKELNIDSYFNQKTNINDIEKNISSIIKYLKNDFIKKLSSFLEV